jgi:hypothetical protein
MASFGGRLSTDSEGPSLTTSQIGSLDELGNLAAAAVDAASPRPRAAAGVSGLLGKTLTIPMSPSRRGFPRPSSHGSLLAALSEAGGSRAASGAIGISGGGGGGVYRTVSGRVNVLRPIEMTSSVPSTSSGTLS